MARLSLTLILGFCLLLPLHADYRITGTVNLENDWQNTIYLATVNKLDDYYNADAALIVNSTIVNPDGSFVMRGNNLPSHAQFYRLYLVKEEHSEFNACLFVGGEEHNFIHLLLDNQTEVAIKADEHSYAPFGNYDIESQTPNQLMRQLGAMVYPSYVFYEVKFPSELQFSQDKLNRDLFQFADTCSNTLVALAALNNTDFDSYFDDYKAQYTAFAQQLKSELPTHPYTEDYLRKMRYYGEAIDTPWHQQWSFWTSMLLAGLCGFLFWKNRQLQQSLTGLKSRPSTPAVSFTQQEEKIIQLILAGRSNKEIAQELFVELSTVKSHINRIYSKLSVNNRKEAIAKVKALNRQ